MRSPISILQVPIVAYLSAIFMDALTTDVCLRFVNYCVEGNPHAAWLFEHLGGIWPTAVLQGAIVVLVAFPLWSRWDRVPAMAVPMVWALLLFLAVQRWTVVAQNLTLLSPWAW